MHGTMNGSPWQTHPKRRTPHICIVGAGFAGLKCADVLAQNGIEVTILEGRDRLGGRVCPRIIFFYFSTHQVRGSPTPPVESCLRPVSQAWSKEKRGYGTTDTL